MSIGQLVVITGPSGVGKGTLVKLLLANNPSYFLSVSATTRAPRLGETEGESYFFLSREQFQAWIEAGDLLEWAEYAGNYYGTPRRPVEERIQRGETVILEIEVLGARQIRQTFPEAKRVFILPPSERELESRLRGRGLDSDAAIARRLLKAKEELAASAEFDYQVINDDLRSALAALEGIIRPAAS
ncbi:MAG: guanylate kinase [Cyanobacteria bacterium RI_101]|nr:guanylate kinase [Cyanobacteria bacterium RI_101]